MKKTAQDANFMSFLESHVIDSSPVLCVAQKKKKE